MRYHFVPLLLIAISLVGCTISQTSSVPEATASPLPLTPVSLKDLFPPLDDLPGDVRPEGGGGGDATRRGISFELDSSHSLQQLHQHYTDQLAEAGWVLQSQEIKKHSTVSSWQVIDINGQSWTATMVINDEPANSGSDYLVEINASLSS